MLGSCSSSDDLNGGGTGNPGFNKDGNGFMSISVNLPTRSGSTTRAENDKYEDGLSSEYEVKNGILALFFRRRLYIACCLQIGFDRF